MKTILSSFTLGCIGRTSCKRSPLGTFLRNFTRARFAGVYRPERCRSAWKYDFDSSQPTSRLTDNAPSSASTQSPCWTILPHKAIPSRHLNPSASMDRLVTVNISDVVWPRSNACPEINQPMNKWIDRKRVSTYCHLSRSALTKAGKLNFTPLSFTLNDNSLRGFLFGFWKGCSDWKIFSPRPPQAVLTSNSIWIVILRWLSHFWRTDFLKITH